MRFAPDPIDAEAGDLDPVGAQFQKALIDAIYLGLREAPLEETKREAVAIAMFLEIRETLYGAIPVEAPNGEFYALVWLAAGKADRAATGTGTSYRERGGERSRLEEYETELLFHFLEIIDDRLVECDFLPPASVTTISEILRGVGAVIDGAIVMPTPRGDIAPLLAFTREAPGADATASGEPTRLREIATSVVARYFEV